MRADSDRGSIPIVVAGVMTIALATITTLAVAEVALLRARAAAAADLAALAAVNNGCAAAERVALANGYTLDACALEAPNVRVAVSTASPALIERLTGNRISRITASALAGPP